MFPLRQRHPATGVAFDDHEYYYEAGYSNYPSHILNITDAYFSFFTFGNHDDLE